VARAETESRALMHLAIEQCYRFTHPKSGKRERPVDPFTNCTVLL
jgi:hypothetical protein